MRRTSDITPPTVALPRPGTGAPPPLPFSSSTQPTAVPMTQGLDFTALYRELDLAPGCTPERLRTAYRRRVSRLHPDQGGDAEDAGRLQQLNRLYRAALEFERTHGRLPGVGSGDRVTSGPDAGLRGPGRGEPAPPGAPASGGPSPAEAREGIPRSFLAVVVAAVCVLAWRVLIDAMPPQDAPTERAASTAAPAPPAPQQTAERHDGLLLPGMSREAVIEIQGEPLDRRAQRWLYGPSWVEFACDRVVGWYSSPLQPLRVRMEQPTATAAEVCAL